MAPNMAQRHVTIPRLAARRADSRPRNEASVRVGPRRITAQSRPCLPCFLCAWLADAGEFGGRRIRSGVARAG